MYKQRKSVIADAYSLAPRLRAEDAAEVAKCGHDPLEDLIHGVENSRPAMTAYRESDGLPIAMYGVVPAEPYSRVGVVWLLGSPELVQGAYCKQFLRECRSIVEHLNDTYPILTNVIDAANVVHVRWIEWCGFNVEQCVHINGHMFYMFRRIKNV